MSDLVMKFSTLSGVLPSLSCDLTVSGEQRHDLILSERCEQHWDVQLTGCASRLNFFRN